MRFATRFALLLTLAAPVAAQPALTVPADLSVADPVPVRVTGLPRHTPVDLISLRRARAGDQTYVARATVAADTLGRIDLGRQAPLAGSYTGADKAGLFWSATARASVLADPAPGEVRIVAQVAGRDVATATARARPDPSAFVTEQNAAFPGAIFERPARPGRYPVIIVLGGSEGGASTARDFAPLFAAHGYATLGLPYYSPGYDPADLVAGLPTTFTDIPVDRLAQVRDWLAARGDVDVARIGIWGASKGAEFALIAASHYDWVKAVVAVVPTDVVWEGWGKPGVATASFAFGGEPLPFMPYAGMDAELAKAARGEAMDLRAVHLAGRAANPGRLAAARIRIEDYAGPLLVVGGGMDRIWPSAEMTRSIAASRAAAGRSTQMLVYPNAGHALGGPGTEPATPLAVNGGNPAAIAAGRTEAWRATFALFDAALRP